MDGSQETAPDSQKSRIPTGLRELLLDLTEKVVFARPKNIYLFCAKYLETLVTERDKATCSTQQHSPPSRSATSSPPPCSKHDLPVSVTGHESIFKLTTSSHEITVPSALHSSTSEVPVQASPEEIYDVLSTKNDSLKPSHGGRQRDTPVQLAPTHSPSVIPVVTLQIQESLKIKLITNKLLVNATALGMLSSRLPLQFIPRPPNSRPPNRPARTWTAQMLSRLTGRARCLRTTQLAPDSSQLHQPLPKSLPASDYWQGEHVVDHALAPADSEGCYAGDRSGTVGHHIMYDSDEELNALDRDVEWWLDGINSKLFKGIRRRKKPPRNNGHKGIFRSFKRPEIVYSYDRFSESHLRVLVYVDEV